MFFRTKLDPYVLLSHAFASQHNQQCDTHSINEENSCVTACADQVNIQVHQVASYMLSQG